MQYPKATKPHEYSTPTLGGYFVIVVISGMGVRRRSDGEQAVVFGQLQNETDVYASAEHLAHHVWNIS
jgi:hypothetical protein